MFRVAIIGDDQDPVFDSSEWSYFARCPHPVPFVVEPNEVVPGDISIVIPETGEFTLLAQVAAEIKQLESSTGGTPLSVTIPIEAKTQ